MLEYIIKLVKPWKLIDRDQDMVGINKTKRVILNKALNFNLINKKL